MQLKYGIIGTGAIGGYYGGILAKSGLDVHFLFHSDYRHVKEHGLKIDSVKGNFHLQNIQSYNTTTDMPQCDVIFVCLKSTNNKLLKELLPPILHSNTVVILIQNGLGLEADLQKDFPTLHIAGALAFICSNKVGEGHISHLDYGKLNIGSYSCPNNDILIQVCKDLHDAGIESELLELQTARWKKLVWNIPFNGMTVVLNTTTNNLMTNRATYRLLHSMMTEVVRAANRVGCAIPETYTNEIMEMTEKMTPYSPSMKLDFEAKRPLEIEYIYSRPIEEASKHGYEMSRVSMLEKQLRFIEDNYLR